MPLLEVTSLRKLFPIARSASVFRPSTEYIHAVDSVSFSLERGETLGIVGESGCGKSTLGRCILRLIQPTSGTVRFEDSDLAALSREEMRKRRRSMQMVFQDPYASLSPRMKISTFLREPLALHKIVPHKEIPDEIRRLLQQVGLPASAENRYPHEFSGGQRQRIGIARAIAVRPKLIVADEPVSALDVSIRAQILNLFRRIQRETETSLIFIAHDLGAVRQISNRVAVMYLGKIVELSPSEELFTNPRHPYTRSLLAAIPSIKTPSVRPEHVQSEIPSPIHLPTGCRFHTRCPYVQPICRETEPSLLPVSDASEAHASACHFAGELPEFVIH